MNTQTHLYHGTLLRNVSLIEEHGLVPMIGTFTENAYGKNAKGVVPAVFMSDTEGLERVVHAMVAAIINEVIEEDFEEYNIGADYHLNDELFFKYGAILVVEKADTFAQAGCANPGMQEPEQAEGGDWYALEVVRPIRTIAGEELRDFLSSRGLTPSNVNDFVDPETVRAITKAPEEPPLCRHLIRQGNVRKV